MRRQLYLILVLGFSTFIMIACQPEPQLTITVTPGDTPEAEANVVTQVTPELTAAVSEDEARVLVVWLPDQLFPSENAEVTAAFESQIRSFVAAEGELQIELRRKAGQGLGGILSTLRSATGVAPGALPDLTLLRYEDFLAAEQANLLSPFEGLVATSVTAELDDAAVQLSTVEGQFYGMPYLLDVLMSVHTEEDLSEADFTFDDVLENRLRFASPVNRSGGISEVFWLQYLAAGGISLEAGTTTALNEQALLEVLTFYENLVQAGLIDETILDYSSAVDYLPGLADGSVDFGLVNSTQFNQLAGSSRSLYPATIPTQDGAAIAQVNGWIWVLTASDAQQQALAGRLVNWLLDVDRQGAYAQSLGMIASRSDTLRLYPPEGLSLDFIDSLLANAQTPISAVPTGNTLRAMQTALISVIRDEVSAREAAQRAVDQLSG